MIEVPLYAPEFGTCKTVKTIFWHRYRCRANLAHTRQSVLDSGLGFWGEVLETF